MMRKIDGQFYHILSAQRKAIIITWLKTSASEPKASQKLFHPWSSKSWGVPIQYSFKNRHWNVHQTATSHSSQFVIVCPFLSQGSEYRCLLLHCNNPSLPHSQEGIFFSYLFASNIVERIVIDIHMSGHCWAAANLMPPFVRSSPC